MHALPFVLFIILAAAVLVLAAFWHVGAFKEEARNASVTGLIVTSFACALSMALGATCIRVEREVSAQAWASSLHAGASWAVPAWSSEDRFVGVPIGYVVASLGPGACAGKAAVGTEFTRRTIDGAPYVLTLVGRANAGEHRFLVESSPPMLDGCASEILVDAVGLMNLDSAVAADSAGRGRVAGREDAASVGAEARSVRSPGG